MLFRSNWAQTLKGRDTIAKDVEKGKKAFVGPDARPARAFWCARVFLGSGAFRRHGKGRFVYFLDTRAVIITKNRRHILAVFVELGYTITT